VPNARLAGNAHSVDCACQRESTRAWATREAFMDHGHGTRSG
jgi:hypothetical protein